MPMAFASARTVSLWGFSFSPFSRRLMVLSGTPESSDSAAWVRPASSRSSLINVPVGVYMSVLLCQQLVWVDLQRCRYLANCARPRGSGPLAMLDPADARGANPGHLSEFSHVQKSLQPQAPELPTVYDHRHLHVASLGIFFLL